MTSVKLKYNLATFPNLKVNFWAIPKCGNTSLKYALIRANDPASFAKMQAESSDGDIEQWVHQAGMCKYITPEQANKNGFVNFAVVRDPIDRFTSGFKDFTQKRPTHRMVGSKYFVQEFKKLRQEPTMDHLLGILQNTTDDERDMHFKSQSYFCAPCDDLKLLSLNNIATTIKTIHPDINANEQLHSTPSTPHLRTMMNVYLIDLYSKDCELYRSSR